MSLSETNAFGEKRPSIGKAIASLRPNSRWIIYRDDYSTLEWEDINELPAPTEAEVNKELERLTEEYNRTRYRGMRREEYPSMEEQLDMIYHDIDAWRETINRIKAKYPKPE